MFLALISATVTMLLTQLPELVPLHTSKLDVFLGLEITLLNSLTGNGAYMHHFLNYFRSRLSSDVGICTQVTYDSDYESSALALQHTSLKHLLSLKYEGAVPLRKT